MPIQKSKTKPGKPASATVGISGSALERLAVLTAMARIRLSRIDGMEASTGVNMKSTRPALVSTMVSGVPLNGMWVSWILAWARNFSAFTWVALPTPADA